MLWIKEVYGNGHKIDDKDRIQFLSLLATDNEVKREAEQMMSHHTAIKMKEQREKAIQRVKQEKIIKENLEKLERE